MIELSEEQRQKLSRPEPVVIDPLTQETYVLVHHQSHSEPTMRFALTAVLFLAAALAPAAEEAPYDLVIRNGKIVDGAGVPWFRGDVAIRGDRIVKVGRVGPMQAKREIDANGLVVAPGFIDMHSHS